MRTTLTIAAAMGLAGLLALMLAQDAGRLGTALATLGPAIAWICLFRAIPLAIHARGWHSLMPRDGRPGFGRVLAMRWIGESINTLLPVGQVGGDVARARLLTAAGLPPQVAGAGVAVDFLLGILSQAVFAMIGVAALLAAAPGLGLDSRLIVGVAVLLVIAVLLVALQRKGFFAGLAGATRRLMGAETAGRLAEGAAGLDREVAVLVADRRRMLTGFGWRLAGWLTHVGEAWLLLDALGTSAGLAAALALESLAWAVRSAAFLVPGAIGAQEGGIVAVGMLLGLPAETALALALAKRAREMLVCGPGLVAWLAAERHGIGSLLTARRPR